MNVAGLLGRKLSERRNRAGHRPADRSCKPFANAGDFTGCDVEYSVSRWNSHSMSPSHPSHSGPHSMRIPAPYPELAGADPPAPVLNLDGTAEIQNL